MSKKRTIKKLENSNFSTVIIDLLNKYFTKKRAEIFVKKINDDPLTYNFIDPLAPIPKSFTDIINDKFSIKFRLFVDMLISYCFMNLNEEKYYKLITDLVRITINCCEFILARELINNLLSGIQGKEELNSIIGYIYLHNADLNGHIGNWKDSESSLKKARTIFELEKDNYGLGYSEIIYASVFLDKGEIQTARIRIENSVVIAKRINSKKLEALININNGVTFVKEGNFNNALKYFELANVVLQKNIDIRLAVDSLLSIGVCLGELEFYRKALMKLDHVITLALSYRLIYILVLALQNKSEILTIIGEPTKAYEVERQALEISHYINDNVSIAFSYKNIGIIEKLVGNCPQAEEYFLLSLNLSREYNYDINYAESAFELAKLYKETNRKKEAKKYFEEALEYYKKNKIQSKVDEIKSYL